jgi:hypothetical protein
MPRTDVQYNGVFAPEGFRESFVFSNGWNPILVYDPDTSDFAPQARVVALESVVKYDCEP